MAVSPVAMWMTDKNGKLEYLNKTGFDWTGLTSEEIENDQWINSIAKLGMTWENHVSDLGGWQSQAAALYGINSIPAAFLIDENGIIVAKGEGLRGAGLENELTKLIKDAK